MSISSLPEPGTNVIASRTRSLQVPWIVDSPQFGVSAGTAPLLANLPARGMANVRCQLLHYPVYDPTGVPASALIARNYLMFRLVGTAAPFKPYDLTGFTLGGTTGYTPLTPQMLVPVGTVLEVVIPAAGFEVVWLEFDATAGTPGPQQGYDLVLVTLTASAA